MLSVVGRGLRSCLALRQLWVTCRAGRYRRVVGLSLRQSQKTCIVDGVTVGLLRRMLKGCGYNYLRPSLRVRGSLRLLLKDCRSLQAGNCCGVVGISEPVVNGL